MTKQRSVLVTGATGYIGGRLIPCLLDGGYAVRCFVRDPARLQGRPWVQDVEIIEGNVLQPDTLLSALSGIDDAIYLIHSMATGRDLFAEHDRQAAANFRQAADFADVQHIIYLGGLKPQTGNSSQHLSSRLETGAILRAGKVPVTEFQAGIIVGSGSLSFEIIRYFAERVPVMICPRWAQTPTQPIAIRTVLQYLIKSLENPPAESRVLEVGGNDVLSYGDMIRSYARVRGLRRWVIAVPYLTPKLGPFWMKLTPFPAPVVRSLIEGLDHELVVHNTGARKLFDVRPLAYEAAVRLALRRFARGNIDTMWHDAMSSSVPDGNLLMTLRQQEGMIRERMQVRVRTTPSAAFQVFKSLGGETGWLYGDALWRLRGLLDRLVGGVGLRRGRRSPTELRIGDAVDFWRVEAIEENRLLRLRAEMKVPGRAWLQFDTKPYDEDRVRIRMTAFFEPKGVWGLLYWYSLYPIHHVMFKGMIRALGRRAQAANLQPQAQDVAALSLHAESN